MNIDKFKKIKDSFTDWKNGKCPFDYKEEGFNIDRMTSNAILYLLTKGVSIMPQSEAYVCYGVYRGGTLIIPAYYNQEKECIGVDNWSEFNDDEGNESRVRNMMKDLSLLNIDMQTMNAKEFYDNCSDIKCGLHMIDGNHSYDGTMEALVGCQPMMTKESIIIVDDTDREEDVRKATFDFLETEDGEDWKVLWDIQGANYIKDIHMSEAWWSGIIVLYRK